MVKNISLIIFIITTLVVSLQANAGFRAALSALYQRDADKMLKEVKCGVAAKDFDGAHLFMGTLEAQYVAGEFLPADFKNKKAELDLKANPKLPGFQTSIANAWSGFLSKEQRNALAKQLRNVPNSFNNEVNSLNERLVNKLLLDKTYGDNYTTRYDEWVKKINLALVMTGIERLEQYGFSYSQSELKSLKQILRLDEQNGYALLEETVLDMTESDDSYQAMIVACLIGDAYAQGLYNKPKDLYQAMLWYKYAYSRNEYDEFSCADGLKELYKTGVLDRHDAVLAAKFALKPNGMPKPEEVDGSILPDLIAQRYQSNSELPLLVIQNLNPSYIIQLYSNGLVRYYNRFGTVDFVSRVYPSAQAFRVYTRDYQPMIGNAAVGSDEWKVSPSIFKSLVRDIEDIGFKVMRSKDFKAKHQPWPDSGIHRASLTVTLRTVSEENIVHFEDIYPRELHAPDHPEQAAILTLLEKYVSTQHIRCGEKVLGEKYEKCVAIDKKTKEIGEAWIKERMQKKQNAH